MRQRRAAIRTTVVATAALAMIATVTGTGSATAVPTRVGPVKQLHGLKAAGETPSERTARLAGFQLVPKHSGAARRATPGPAEANPFLSLVRDPAHADLAHWRAKVAAEGKQRARAQATTKAAPSPLLVDEKEADDTLGGNDSPANAEPITAFGSAAGKRAAARILGTVAPAPGATEVGPVAEDNGAIPLAGKISVPNRSRRITTGEIGDGPHGSGGDARGDFDFYSIKATAGQRLVVDIDARDSDPGNPLDTGVILWDKDGEIVDSDDDGPTGADSLLDTKIPASGTYYVSVSAWDSTPGNPFDPAGGGGATSEGSYSVTFGLNPITDLDYYAVNLRAGDVLSGTVKGAASTLSVLDSNKRQVFGSSQDASGIYPATTPLTGGGRATVDHVAATAGKYYLGVSGEDGNYDVTLEVLRPKLENSGAQTIYLDFDGARLNTAVFGGPGVSTLSPFSAFLGRWGIPSSQKNALIDRVVSTVTENLQRDLAGTGVAVKVLNSRDTPEQFGKKNVSRVVVGGTISESGVDTIGIAQSIDPGNFDTAETALVLLDVVSGSADEYGSATMNSYITSKSNKVKFVGTALGNVIAHEAGHFLGNWHVDSENAQANLMDEGGNFAQMFGVGADGIGGTGDDPDVDFGEDTLSQFEGFSGVENTRARTAWGLHGLLS